MVTQEFPMQCDPAWLNSPPEPSFPHPPVDTHAQTLPYHELSWENFERLILRIVRREATVKECWVYGERGQKQYGLDILAVLDNALDEYACYQCKRVEKFSAADIEKAVTTFLAGKWACKTKRFILCTSVNLTETQQVDEIAKQKTILATNGIEFATWDGSEGGQLSEHLKEYPDLVDDFFLRDWVRIFNGKEAADSLGERLDGSNLAELRTQLQQIYSTLFQRYDPGIRIASGGNIPIRDRYVAPTIIEVREVAPDGTLAGSKEHSQDERYSERQQAHGQSTRPTIQEIRMPVGDWFSRHKRSVILGEPGYGKSTLLRVVAMQLLNGLDEPFSLPWRGVLPVWISFGGFSAAVQRENGISVEDYFDQWLHQHGADPIRQIFKRAVKYGELLLLIDGLDEGQDPYAARQAMDRLSTFLSIRSIPTIFTSRPRSYTQVRPDGAWPIARLASFDEAQIEFFAYTWFKHLERPEVAVPKNDAPLEVSAIQRKEDFLKAVHSTPQITDLARTPLFCQLLIDIFRFHHHLPEQRIRVYDKIIELLLSDHPTARIQAAGLPVPPNIPRIDDLREMLMRLAYQIQVAGSAGVISAKDCHTVFCTFLTDDVHGPGYTAYEAQHQSKAVINYAQMGLGLLVERAPDEYGFFHLTIQEYLAAQGMTRKEEREQLDWLTDVWDQPRWHEVVVAWFSIMGAGQGRGMTQRAIDHLKQIATKPLARLRLLQLRAELATSDYGLSPREARATIEEAADQVEYTPFPALRQELAKHLTLGLRSASVAKPCEERIANWVPARSEWERAKLLEVFGGWEMSEGLLHTLKLALHDESGRCRWAAAESLAKAFVSDDNVRDHLATLAAKWPDTGVRAAALHGLGKGWPEYDGLNDLADAARDSADMNLALNGIALRVANHRQDEIDGNLIWSMISHGSVSFEIRDFCREVLVAGWRSDLTIKNSAMEVLRNRWQHGKPLEEEQILSYLAEAWPGDEEVGRSIAGWFTSMSPSFLMHDQDKWKKLFKGFRCNNDLASALRPALSDRKAKYRTDFWDPDMKWAYCVIGDDAVKMEVLEAYASVSGDRNKSWVVSTLMEAWPEDDEVRKLLSREFSRPPGEVAFLSSWIDPFVPDPQTRRSWLLEALKHSDRRTGSAPVHRLLAEFGDEECVKAVRATLEEDIWCYDKIVIKNQLIARLPNLPEVHQWAESSFFEIDGPSLSSVAVGYQQDQLIRDRLLKVARPAKMDVRYQIFRVFMEYSIPKDIGLRLTEGVWAEEKGEIRNAGVIARCILASQSMGLREPLIKRLREEIKSLGFHYELRRRAAFAGLLQLGEYDICIEATAEESPSALHWLAEYHDPDVVLPRMLFKHLENLRETSQLHSRAFEIPWGPLIYNGVAREAFSNNKARAQLIEYLKAMKPQDRSPDSLRLMAELLPKSMELRTHLIGSIKEYFLNDTPFEAQRILAEQFGGDVQALIELQGDWQKPDVPIPLRQIHPPFLYAIALGWPDSPLLRPYLEQQALPQEFPLLTALALCGINGDEKQALACIDRLIDITIEDGRPLPSIYPQSLRDWAGRHHAETLLRSLIYDPDPSRKITAIGLLASIGKLTNEDRLLLAKQFDEITGGAKEACRDGVDVLDGKVTTLHQAIFRILTTE